MKKVIPWLRKITLIVLCLFMVLSWGGLGRDYLFDWDEGIYATLGREMKESGNLLTPTWNGDLWLEKPPAIAWVTGLGMKLAGENELGARLFMPVFAGITLYGVFLLGELIGGTLMGTISMAILGYFNLFLARLRAVNTDGMLLAGITWSSYLLLSNAPAWMVGVVMGLSIMVKGPAGLLAIFIALPLLINKPRKYILYSIFYVLVLILPWHLYAYLVHGQSFLTPYLLEQVLRRATVPIEFHTESRWFYFNFLYQDLGIGVLLVTLLGYFFLFKNWLHKKTDSHKFLVMWWLALPLLLFTAAKTRLSWYILPVYPAIALSIGYGLRELVRDHRSRAVISILAVGMLFQMMWHGYQYVAPFRSPSKLSDPLVVATKLSTYPGTELAMLVSPNERVAEAILPSEQTISSSFRYGGAPSVVWYSQKHVHYYYNYDQFTADLATNKIFTTVIVTVTDVDKLPPGFTQVISSDGYLGYVRGDNYALR